MGKSGSIKQSADDGGAFLTQKGEKPSAIKNEISELEQLLASAGQTSQSTLLLKKRKEVREVDESLELTKRDFKRRMDACEEKRLQFEQKQAKMREQVLKFEKFIQENDAKRQRAEAKAKQEKQLYNDKLKELEILNEKIRKLEAEQNSLINELVRKNGYKTYLERIVEEGEFGYEEISEILNRHNTLNDANKDLMSHASAQEKEADEFRRKLQLLKTEKQNHVLVSTSLVQRNQKALEKLKIDVKIEEEMKSRREDKKKDVSKELSQTIAAIKNLFGRCFNSMRVKPVYNGHKDNAALMDILEFELDVIHIRIADLKDISFELQAGGDLQSSSDLKDNSVSMSMTLPNIGSLSLGSRN